MMRLAMHTPRTQMALSALQLPYGPQSCDVEDIDKIWCLILDLPRLSCHPRAVPGRDGSGYLKTAPLLDCSSSSESLP